MEIFFVFFVCFYFISFFKRHENKNVVFIYLFVAYKMEEPVYHCHFDIITQE